MALAFDILHRLDEPKSREEFLIQLASCGINVIDPTKIRDGVAKIDAMIVAWNQNVALVLADDRIDDFMPIVMDGMGSGIQRIFRENFFALTNAVVSWEIDDHSGEWGFMLKRPKC